MAPTCRFASPNTNFANAIWARRRAFLQSTTPTGYWRLTTTPKHTPGPVHLVDPFIRDTSICVPLDACRDCRHERQRLGLSPPLQVNFLVHQTDPLHHRSRADSRPTFLRMTPRKSLRPRVPWSLWRGRYRCRLTTRLFCADALSRRSCNRHRSQDNKEILISEAPSRRLLARENVHAVVEQPVFGIGVENLFTT